MINFIDLINVMCFLKSFILRSLKRRLIYLETNNNKPPIKIEKKEIKPWELRNAARVAAKAFPEDDEIQLMLKAMEQIEKDTGQNENDKRMNEAKAWAKKILDEVANRKKGYISASAKHFSEIAGKINEPEFLQLENEVYNLIFKVIRSELNNNEKAANNLVEKYSTKYQVYMDLRDAYKFRDAYNELKDIKRDVLNEISNIKKQKAENEKKNEKFRVILSDVRAMLKRLNRNDVNIDSLLERYQTIDEKINFLEEILNNLINDQKTLNDSFLKENNRKIAMAEKVEKAAEYTLAGSAVGILAGTGALAAGAALGGYAGAAGAMSAAASGSTVLGGSVTNAATIGAVAVPALMNASPVIANTVIGTGIAVGVSAQKVNRDRKEKKNRGKESNEVVNKRK